MKCSTIFWMLQLKMDVTFFDFLANGLIQRVTSDSILKMSEVISVTYLRTSSGICSTSLRRFLNSQGLGWGVLVTIGKGTVVCSVVSVVAAASVVVAAAAVGASVSVVTTTSVVVVGGLVGASVSVVTTASVVVVGGLVGASVLVVITASVAVVGADVGALVVTAVTVEGLTVGASVIAAAAVEGTSVEASVVNESKSLARFLNPFQIWLWWTFTSASWSLISGRALAWKYR